MPTAAKKKIRQFDPNIFLATIGEGRKLMTVAKKKSIFTQGDAADAVFYIQKGKVRLTVVSKTGKEATIGIVERGNFFRRRFAGRPDSPHGIGGGDDGLRTSAESTRRR